ncbi:putative Zinc finger, MIZ-type, Zinc finger, RING/FYVE/PHD-type [Helianthus annuus]|nr:putative Zinc finger, MIZ-type, Zinc finger, RING/FYVE/PHD-type [Helianthus annuus]
MKPATVAGTVDMSTGQTLSPSYVNSFRISAVTSRLLVHLRGEANADKTEFCNLCLSLARGIDYAVSNNDIPGRAPDLPNLLKQVCQRKNDLTSQAAVMVLMISVKSACSSGWFSEKIKEELYVLSDEMQRSFCSVSIDELNSNVKNKNNNFHLTISTIMSRFYPGMKMGEVFSLVETKPGYDSYVTDLHISKRSRTSPEDKIYLFVAQTDNIETSACLISPLQVNFLLNGEGVDKRTCVYKDFGPQMPTHVTHMLKYGSNLLQVVGQFNARYIIAIAFMRTVSNPSYPIIPDYVQPVAAQPDSDNEIIEGPSRISLKCPISFSRIKNPVKGHSCKHLQCFDFNNYVELNSKRPLWRCPHCSQSVCFHDLRIDQSMVKVLKEVGEDVSYVKISGDGSWEAVTDNIGNELTEKPNDTQPLNQETTSRNVDDVMDLTENDNEIDKFEDNDDKKSSPAGVSSVTNKNTAPHMEDEFWGEFYSPARLDAGDVIQRNRLLFNSLARGQSQSQSQSQSETPVSGNTPSQQNENSNNNNNNDGNVRYPTSASWVTNTRNAIQALPAQNSARTVDGDIRHNFSRSHLNHRSASPLSTDRFSSHQTQSLNQRAHLPVRSSGQPAPHVRLGGVGPMTSLASSHSAQYSLSAIQRATSQIRSPTSSVTPPIQTSGSSSVTVAATGDHRETSVDGSAEENWRPTGRMRGSLSGQQYTEALKHKFIIQPSEPVQAARPPPVLNTPRPFIPPHLQALMANNNPRPQAGGSGPGSDSSMAGDAATGDK